MKKYTDLTELAWRVSNTILFMNNVVERFKESNLFPIDVGAVFMVSDTWNMESLDHGERCENVCSM